MFKLNRLDTCLIFPLFPIKIPHFTDLFKNKIVNARNDTNLYHVSTDRHMLELGRSKSWTRALEDISGDTRMDSQPLMNYFSTLYDWLKAENQKNNRQPGWDAAIDPCKRSVPENSTAPHC